MNKENLRTAVYWFVISIFFLQLITGVFVLLVVVQESGFAVFSWVSGYFLLFGKVIFKMPLLSSIVALIYLLVSWIPFAVASSDLEKKGLKYLPSLIVTSFLIFSFSSIMVLASAMGGLA